MIEKSAVNAIIARDLIFQYSNNTILNKLNFEIPKGQFISVLGPSGSGKSTLLRLLAGLSEPTSGEISKSSQQCGVVFQDPRLLPWRTTQENVHLPLELLNINSSSANTNLYKLTGIESFKDLFPHQLSGGMKQRVALARALVLDADMLFFDEPFSALDEMTRESLQDLLLSIWNRNSKTCFFVTHSLQEAAYLSERVLILSSDGQIKWDLNFESTEFSIENEIQSAPRNSVELIKRIQLLREHFYEGNKS